MICGSHVFCQYLRAVIGLQSLMCALGTCEASKTTSEAMMDQVSSWSASVTEALANKDYAASAWGGFETYMNSFDQGLLALVALVIGASFVARGFAIMKPLSVLTFAGGLAAHTSIVALHEGQGLAGGISAIVVGLCGVIFAHRVYPLFVFFLGCVLGGGATFLCRSSLGLAGTPTALIGLMMLLSVFAGLVMSNLADGKP
eukprot:s82_g24.t1